MRPHRHIASFTLACASLLGGTASAQDAAPAEDSAPTEDATPETPADGTWPEVSSNPLERERALAEPGEEVRVDRPDELERIQGELARLQRLRMELAAEEVELSERMRDLSGDDLAPTLQPRREVVRLSLEEAIAQALEHNPDFLVTLLNARATEENVPIAESAFDPTLSGSLTYAESRPPFFSTNPFSGLPQGLSAFNAQQTTSSISLTKTFQLGTNVVLTYSDQRQRNDNQFDLQPQYAPQIDLTVTQPLLRGFGFEANQANIRIAENTALQADATYAQTLMNGILSVESAYWELVRAEEQLRFQERSLASALKFLDDQERRREVGAAADLDVIIAQAGVASNREGVISAENALETARDNLLRLIRPPTDASKWDLLIVPTDRPWLRGETEPSVADALEVARRRRPDLYQAQLDLDSARHNLVLQRNQALPSVNVFGGLREQGLATSHHRAWTELTSGQFYSWQVGVSVELPLFLRAERARVRQAELQLRQAEAAMRSADADTVLEIRRTIRNIRTAKSTVEAARDTRVLAARRLRATRTQVEHGTAVPRDVLEDLASLASAENREIQAYINYRLALSNLHLAEGALLDPFLDRVDPRVRAAINR